MISLHHQSPNSLSSMVCSVISELSVTTQKQLLGVICSGHRLTSTSDPSFINVFSIPNLNIVELSQTAQFILENLRTKWPVSAAPSCWSPLILRQVKYHILIDFLNKF